MRLLNVLRLVAALLIGSWLTLLMEMRRHRLRLGCAALCVGGGQGAAFILERDG